MVGNMSFLVTFFVNLKGGKLVGFQENIYEKTVFKGSVYTFLIYIYIHMIRYTRHTLQINSQI